MGYTHYWSRPKTILVRDWKLWTGDVRRLVDAWPNVGGVSIHEGMGIDPPWIGPHDVTLNGHAARDEDHEAFVVARVFSAEKHRGRYQDFCKTARKPYDLVVVAALCRLKLRVPKAMLSSDGDSADWGRGIDFCTEVFGEGHETPDGIDKVMCSRCQERVAQRTARFPQPFEGWDPNVPYARWTPVCTPCFDAVEDWEELNWNPSEARQ